MVFLIKQRMTQMRSLMKERKIDAYLIPTADFHNSEYVSDYFMAREYMSGFSGSNGTLVVMQKEAGLFTDGRYFIQAEKELAGTDIILYRMGEENVPTVLQFLESKITAGSTIAFDGRVIDAKYGQRLQKITERKAAHIKYEEDLVNIIWKDRPPLPQGDVFIISNELAGQSVSKKLVQVRTVMKEEECAYFLLSKLDDIMWLFNIRGNDIACNPVCLSYAFVTEDQAFLFLSPSICQKDKLSAYAAENNITLKAYEDISEFLTLFPYKGAILYDEDNINYTLYKIVSEKCKTVNAVNPTTDLKAIKNEAELSHMRNIFCKDSAAVTKFIYWLKHLDFIKEYTEYDAAQYLEDCRRSIEEFFDISFPTISAYMENAAMMHYHTEKETAKTLKSEGLLLVDSGGQYMGGTTDVTRTIALGSISEEMKRQYTAVVSGMLQLSGAHFLYGCSGKNLDILARQPLWDMHIDYKCGTGHGIGYMLSVHEGPQNIRWRYQEGTKEEILKSGMVVSNEPGVYIEGSHGIRIENIMAVKEDVKNSDGQFMQFETLTYVPIDIDAIDVSGLTKRNRQLLNAYHESVYNKVSPYLTEAENAWLYEVTRAV